MHAKVRIAVLLGAFLLILVRVWPEPLTESDLDVLLAGGRWEEAESRARQAVAADADPSSLLILGRVLFASGRTDRLEEALNCLERSTELDPDRASAWYWLGRANGQVAGRGDMIERAQSARQAGTCLTRALELEPGCFAYAWALVRYHLQVPGLLGGDRAAAGNIAAEFVERQPGEQDLLVAAVALKAGDSSLVLDRLGEVDPLLDEEMTVAWTSIATELGESLLQQGQWAEGVSLFLLVTERFPAQSRGWYGLGRALEGRGDSEGAADAYAQCLARAPDGPRADAIQQRLNELQR